MMLSADERTALYERASNLAERFSGVFLPAGNDDAASLRNLRQWQERAGISQNGRFDAMITALADGPLATDQIACLLGPVRMAPGLTLPPWVDLVSEIFTITAAAFAKGLEQHSTFPEPSEPLKQIPFCPLYEPIVDFAQARVEAAFPDAGLLLQMSAWQGLRILLFERISMIASRAMQSIFQAKLSLETSGLAGLFSQRRNTHPDSDKASKGIYMHFVIEQGEDGLKPFISSYPVAARLISQVVLDWIDFVLEFLHRFQADKKTLAEYCHDGKTLQKIVGIRGGISDPHNGGRTVLILRFKDGRRLVYKPRTLTVDTLFFDLVAALNRHTNLPLPKALQVLDCGHYGWMPYAATAPCQSQVQAERFYRRSGALVCLVHWLGGIDCHSENFVAMGEHPVLVDLECMAHPLRLTEISARAGLALAEVGKSPLRTGLLPLLQNPIEGAPRYDNSALGAPLTRLSLYPIPWWHKINSDQMFWTYARRPVTRKQHRPRLLRKTLNARDFTDSVLAGYEQTAGCLRGSQANEFSEHRQRLSGCIRRFIKRPTVIYATLILNTLNPKYLRSGMSRSIELQTLPFEPGNGAERTSEIASLEKLDVPYFSIGGHGKQLPVPSAPSLTSSTCAAEMRQIEMSLRRQLVAVGGSIYEKAPRQS